MMTQVKVLQHHIDQGTPCNAHSCAVALALREQFPDAVYVQVGGATLTVVRPGGTMIARTPRSVATFINRFDGPALGQPRILTPQPFEFDAEFRRQGEQS